MGLLEARLRISASLEYIEYCENGMMNSAVDSYSLEFIVHIFIMTKIFLLFIIAFIPLVFSVSSKEQNVKENNYEGNNFIKAQKNAIIGKKRKHEQR